jgi:hypothetical protein
MGTEIVTLEIGTSKTQYHVHRDLLTRESPYFRAMLGGAWKESSARPIPVPLADNAIFPSFLDWLYFRLLKHHVGTIGGYRELAYEDPCVNCGIYCEGTEISVYELPSLTV